jgi:alanine-glyoxylate transaminase/serine-glyoxylate transaminase/serine-pyruvate transaminase
MAQNSARNPAYCRSSPPAARPRAAGDGRRSTIVRVRQVTKTALEGIKTIKTTNPVVIYTRPAPAPGRAHWSTLSPGDRADGRDRPVRHTVEEDDGSAWPELSPPTGVRASTEGGRSQLREDKSKSIKAVSSCTTRGASRRRGDPQGDAGHPAVRSTPSPHSLRPTIATMNGASMSRSARAEGPDEPPGMSFNAISDKALKASQARLCRSRSSPGTTCST